MTEKITKEYIASLIQSRRPVVLDIGCYDCKDSLELAALLPDEARFYCFEPDPRSQEFAVRNINNSKKFLLNNLAITDYDGGAHLNISYSDTRRHEGNNDWSASSSLQSPAEHLTVFPDVEFAGRLNVPCCKLDTWYYTTLNPKVIDFCWIDTNGAEAKVLRGGLRTLNEKVRFLYIEFEEKQLFEGAPNKADIRDLLPGWEEMGVYDFHGNFGNVLLKNTLI
jgi:FkbM family methyltransferase